MAQSGSENPFDVGEPTVVGYAVVTPAAFDHPAQPVAMPPHTSADTARGGASTARLPGPRGRGLGAMALIAAVASSLALCLGVARALGTIDVLSLDPFRDALRWSSVAVAAVVIAAVALVTSVAGVFWARPRTLAAVALAASLVLPPVGLLVGLQIGVSELHARLAYAVAHGGGAAAVDLLERLGSRGVHGLHLPAWVRVG